MYVYKSFERGLYTVGFYDAKGNWEPESDHDTQEEAVNRVTVLNGGTVPQNSLKATAELLQSTISVQTELIKIVKQLSDRIDALHDIIRSK